MSIIDEKTPEYRERCKCETCLYNKNCQFLATHRRVIVEGCTAYKNSADMVEVVRCSKCMHSTWEQEPCHGKTEYYCTKLKSKVDKHFYCGLGKKKEGAYNAVGVET